MLVVDDSIPKMLVACCLLLVAFFLRLLACLYKHGF